MDDPYLISVISNDDDSSFEGDAPTEGHITRDGQVVQFQDVRNTFEAFQKIFHLYQINQFKLTD